MDKVIELLEAWKQYIEEGNTEDFANFGGWLIQAKTEIKAEEKKGGDFPEQCVTFGRDFGIMTGYAEAWERLAFRDLPIKGFSDFDILNQIKYLDNPTKNLIAQNSTMEQSTVFEVMKRLKQKGLLRDEVDAKDRRVKRLFLTPKGEAMVVKVTELALKMSRLIVGDLNNEEISMVAGFLKRLNDFHGHLYHNKTREEIKEMYDL